MTDFLIPKDRPVIGVFDSGFGGLTVLRALLPRFPGAHFVYLGDTARLPYGAKSQLTVARYAVEAARFLVRHGAKMLVIACNTATALALPEIRAAVDVPVVGVIEPGAQAAFAAVATASHVAGSADRRNILVLATAATVASHAYRDTCAGLGLHSTEMPCPLLVPLVEEGWTDHPVTHEVLRIYLTEALKQTTPDAVVLGCTHYPLITPAITQTLHDLGCNAPVVDSAEATAQSARAAWNGHTFPSAALQSTFSCYATDSVEKFARLGTHFLGQQIPEVHLLDLGG
jgi:glutamate racemase